MQALFEIQQTFSDEDLDCTDHLIKKIEIISDGITHLINIFDRGDSSKFSERSDFLREKIAKNSNLLNYNLITEHSNTEEIQKFHPQGKPPYPNNHYHLECKEKLDHTFFMQLLDVIIKANIKKVIHPILLDKITLYFNPSLTTSARNESSGFPSFLDARPLSFDYSLPPGLLEKHSIFAYESPHFYTAKKTSSQIF